MFRFRLFSELEIPNFSEVYFKFKISRPTPSQIDGFILLGKLLMSKLSDPRSQRIAYKGIWAVFV